MTMLDEITLEDLLSFRQEPEFDEAVELEYSLTEPQDAALCPFRPVIDTNETLAYHFTGIKADTKHGPVPLLVETVRKPLWAMSRRKYELKGRIIEHGLADYSAEGLEEEIQIERKSLDDLYATFGGRRDKFEAEFCRLNECRIAFLVIEADWERILLGKPSYSSLLPKTISRTHDSWQIKYPRVHWVTCQSARHAELKTFRILEMYWRIKQHELKAKAKKEKADESW